MEIRIKFSDAVLNYCLTLSGRDCGILINRDFAEGEMFSREIGVFDLMTLRTGIQKGASWSASRTRLLMVTQLLAQRISRDRELLEFNYSCIWKQRADLAERIGVHPVVVLVNDRVEGFCKLTVLRADGDRRGRELMTIDLREQTEIWRHVLESCKVIRRQSSFDLVERIRGLQLFVANSSAKEIKIDYVTGA